MCSTLAVRHRGGLFCHRLRKAGGGIMVTASHNPADWNGLKLVREGAGRSARHRSRRDPHPGRTRRFRAGTKARHRHPLRAPAAYLRHLLKYVDHDVLRPLKIVVNAGNGCAGPVIDLLEQQLPFAITKIHKRPDGSFPHGIPNPLLARTATPRARRAGPRGRFGVGLGR